jgi:heat shock protein HtpX
VYIAPLETDLFDREDDALLSRDILPATHPPTDERVDRLTEMGAERHTQ